LESQNFFEPDAIGPSRRAGESPSNKDFSLRPDRSPNLENANQQNANAILLPKSHIQAYRV